MYMTYRIFNYLTILIVIINAIVNFYTVFNVHQYWCIDQIRY